MLIAAIGVYGVLAYSVNQRTREIGLRMALGAQQSGGAAVDRGAGMLVAMTGIAIGAGGRLALSRVLASLVFEVALRDPRPSRSSPRSWPPFRVAACLAPALRASRVDPMVALREE